MAHESLVDRSEVGYRTHQQLLDLFAELLVTCQLDEEVMLRKIGRKLLDALLSTAKVDAEPLVRLILGAARSEPS